MLWALRVGWLALPLATGPAIADGLDGTSITVQVVTAALAWIAWGAVLLAVLVPRTASLTALRVGAPAVLGAVVWASARSGIGPAEIVALAWTALIAAAVLFVPVITDAFVDGSSYGPERRMALRVPGTLLLGLLELAERDRALSEDQRGLVRRALHRLGQDVREVHAPSGPSATCCANSPGAGVRPAHSAWVVPSDVSTAASSNPVPRRSNRVNREDATSVL